MKNKLILITAGGVVVVLTSIWGGAYALHIAPPWAEFPAFMSAVLGVMAGVAISLWGAAKLTD